MDVVVWLRSLVSDFDWRFQIVDSPYTETTRLITRSFCDNFKNGWIGRRLPRLFKQHGMSDISIVPQTMVITYPFLEPIREFGIHDEWLAASRLSMMRIMARRMNAATVVA